MEVRGGCTNVNERGGVLVDERGGVLMELAGGGPPQLML